MADLSKLKRRGTLGAPPSSSEASSNLEAPEMVPPAVDPVTSATGEVRRVRDGRSARRTGRTIQFATRVSAAFDERFRTIAERDGLLHVELLEKALDAYDRVTQDKR
jgi:hypothetical protein